MSRYSYETFAVNTPPELGGDGTAMDVYPVVIIGAGPVGLTAAIDLATRGISSVVLDDNNVVSTGSRAICWAKRCLLYTSPSPRDRQKSRMPSSA